MRKIKFFATAAMIAVIGLVIGGLSTGSAHDPAGTTNDPVLSKFTSDPVGTDTTAEVGFKASPVGDAPGSPQDKAIRLANFEATGVSYSGVKVQHANFNNQILSDVSRISFKTRGYSGAGAPRLSMLLSNGTWVYLSAFYCQFPLDANWSKANFTASYVTDPSCTIYTSTVPGNAGYSSDATSTAWEKLVAGEGPGTVVQKMWLVHDEGPSTTWVDDIRLDGILFAGPNVNTHNH